MTTTKAAIATAALSATLACAGHLRAQSPVVVEQAPTVEYVQAAPSVVYVQAPVVNIGRRHGNLRAAQQNIVSAYQSVQQAQQANDGQLGGHAQRAKELLAQADYELRQAANVSNAEGR